MRRPPSGWPRSARVVIVADARGSAAAAVADQIGGDATGVALDLLDRSAVDALATSIEAPDILVTTPSVNVRKAIVDYSDDELDRVSTST